MGIRVEDLEIPDVELIHPPRFGESRGFFSEVYYRRTMAELDIEVDFVQDNHCMSNDIGTIRGLHFQAATASGRVALIQRNGSVHAPSHQIE